MENLTCLNALDGKFWKIYQKVMMDDKINPKIVMDEELVQKIVMYEELVQNGVMHGQFVKNFEMDAKIDPKLVMDVFIFKIGGWKSLQSINPNLLEEFIDENDPLLLIGIPSKDSFFVTQYLERHFVSADPNVKEWMPLREIVNVMMQCYMRQHFADRYWLHEHPGGHASCREPTMKFTKESTTYFVKGPVCRWNVQKMR